MSDKMLSDNSVLNTTFSFIPPEYKCLLGLPNNSDNMSERLIHVDRRAYKDAIMIRKQSQSLQNKLSINESKRLQQRRLFEVKSADMRCFESIKDTTFLSHTNQPNLVINTVNKPYNIPSKQRNKTDDIQIKKKNERKKKYHNTIIPVHLPTTEIIEISSDEELTMDVAVNTNMPPCTVIKDVASNIDKTHNKIPTSTVRIAQEYDNPDNNMTFFSNSINLIDDKELYEVEVVQPQEMTVKITNEKLLMKETDRMHLEEEKKIRELQLKLQFELQGQKARGEGRIRHENKNKNYEASRNMFAKSRSILDTRNKQIHQDRVSKTRINCNINECNYDCFKELHCGLEIDQSTSQTPLFDLYNGVDELHTFDNEGLKSLLEYGSLDSNETDERIPTIGEDQGDFCEHECNSTTRVFDNFAQISNVRKKSFNSRSIKFVSLESMNTNRRLKHSIEDFCQCGEVYDDQTSTPPIRGITNLQSVTSDVMSQFNLNSIASHKTIIPLHLPTTEIIEISSDEELTMDVSKTNDSNLKQNQKQKEETKSFKLKGDKLIKIHEEEAKIYKGKNVKQVPRSIKPVNINMQPCTVVKNIASDTDRACDIIPISKKTIAKEYDNRDNMTFFSNSINLMEDMKLYEVEVIQPQEITVKFANEQLLKKGTERMIKEENKNKSELEKKRNFELNEKKKRKDDARKNLEDNERMKKEEDERTKQKQIDEKVLENKLLDFRETISQTTKDYNPCIILGSVIDGVIEQDFEDFYGKIIHEEIERQEMLYEDYAEEYGCIYDERMKKEKEERKKKEKCPLQTISYKHTFKDKNRCDTLNIPEVTTNEIPLHKIHQLSINNIVKQQEIKPSHDQILKQIVTTAQLTLPTSKKQGCKPQIDELQESNSSKKTNSQKSAKINTLKKKVKAPTFKTRRRLGQCGCKNNSKNKSYLNKHMKKKTLEFVLNSLCKRNEYILFLNKEVTGVPPLYSNALLCPIDLQEIKRKIASGEITQLGELQICLLMMSFNATIINRFTSIVNGDASNFQLDLQNHCLDHKSAICEHDSANHNVPNESNPMKIHGYSTFDVSCPDSYKRPYPRNLVNNKKKTANILYNFFNNSIGEDFDSFNRDTGPPKKNRKNNI